MKNFIKKIFTLGSVVLFFSFGAIGCGYQIGSILPNETIAVPIFHNETLYRGYEFFLTDAVVSEILTTTPLQVVSKNQADSWLKGTIRKLEQQTVTKDEERRATELDITIYVEITWYDKFDKIRLASKRVAETTQVKSNGQNLDSAITEALRKLGRKIVATLEHPYWPKEKAVTE